MKKFLASTAVVALTSTSALAGGMGGGHTGGPTHGLFGGSFSINISPIINVTNQVSTAVGIIVAPTTGGQGATAPTIMQSVSAINWNSTGIIAGSNVRY